MMPTSTRCARERRQAGLRPGEALPGRGHEDAGADRVAVAGDVDRPHAVIAAARSDVPRRAGRVEEVRGQARREPRLAGQVDRALVRPHGLVGAERDDRLARAVGREPDERERMRQLRVDGESQLDRRRLDQAEAVGCLHAQHVRSAAEVRHLMLLAAGCQRRAVEPAAKRRAALVGHELHDRRRRVERRERRRRPRHGSDAVLADARMRPDRRGVERAVVRRDLVDRAEPCAVVAELGADVPAVGRVAHRDRLGGSLGDARAVDVDRDLGVGARQRDVMPRRPEVQRRGAQVDAARVGEGADLRAQRAVGLAHQGDAASVLPCATSLSSTRAVPSRRSDTSPRT